MICSTLIHTNTDKDLWVSDTVQFFFYFEIKHILVTLFKIRLFLSLGLFNLSVSQAALTLIPLYTVYV